MVMFAWSVVRMNVYNMPAVVVLQKTGYSDPKVRVTYYLRDLSKS